MTREELCAMRHEAIAAFAFDGTIVSCEHYGNGHINDTFVVNVEGGSVKRYIMQRMNHEVFKNPDELMANIANVTAFLKKKIIEKGGDPMRETMNVVSTKDGKDYFKDSIGCCWRTYVFIEDATSFDKVEKPDDFYQSAVAFGRFQNLLEDFPAETLHETIVNFHNTPTRYETFLKAVEADVKGRAAEVAEEIAFVKARAEDMGVTMQLLDAGKLPLRVTHNDTKLNNIMIDNATGKAICVIDLDTVMPGLSINDFGDSIRFGANTAAEDETDLRKVSLSLDLFDIYTKGFLEGSAGSLTATELDMLPMGAKLMTLECGTRFLTDYLQGDVYFNIHREKHNLDRCRTQFGLVKDMEVKWAEMKAIVDKYR